MNDIAKKSASDKLQTAIQNEGVTTNKAGALIGIKPIYISMFKNEKYWKSVGMPQWEKLLKWVNSGYPIRDYLKHHPEAALPNDFIDMKTVGIFKKAEKSFEPPEKQQGAPFDEKLDPPEHIASGIPGNDNEITEPEFEGEIVHSLANLSDNVSIQIFIKQNATSVITGEGERYYYLPFWFKMLENAKIEMVSLERLPEDLRKAIRIIRGE